MLETLAQIIFLMIIFGFYFAAIAGNFLRHEEKNAVRSSHSGKKDFAPRVLALSPVRTKESGKAA